MPETNQTLNLEDKPVVTKYIEGLKNRGFCKLDNAASNQTRLFNRFSGETLPLSFIEHDFSHFIRENNAECSSKPIAYILASLVHIVGSKFVPEPSEFYTDPRTGCSYANTYRPYKPKTEPGSTLPLIHEFFERIVPSEAERHTFLQWLSHIFQHPAQRPSWHILLPSDPGTGKGFLLQSILQPLLNHTSVVSSYTRITSKHSTVLEDNLLILLDDCKSRSEATQTELKSILSEERQFVEKKHLQGSMITCYTRFILASNEKLPLYLDSDERRWYVLSRATHRESLEETQRFISRLAAWLESPGALDSVHHFFCTYPLEGFNHKLVPPSEGLQALIAQSQNPYALFLADYASEQSVFSYSMLIAAIKAEGLTKPSDAHLAHLLKEAGIEASRPRIDGKQLTLYHPAGMSLEQVRAAYSSPTY